MFRIVPGSASLLCELGADRETFWKFDLLTTPFQLVLPGSDLRKSQFHARTVHGVGWDGAHPTASVVDMKINQPFLTGIIPFDSTPVFAQTHRPAFSSPRLVVRREACLILPRFFKPRGRGSL